MKKVLLFAVMACAILSGCKNENSTDPKTAESKVAACNFGIQFSDFLNERCVWEIYIDGVKVASLNNQNSEYTKTDFDNTKKHTIETKLVVSGEAPTGTESVEMTYSYKACVAYVNSSTGLSGFNSNWNSMGAKANPDRYQSLISKMEKYLNLKYVIENGNVTKEGGE